MRKIAFLVLIALLMFSAVHSQKAYGPFNFGMSREQYDEAIKNSANILVNKYWTGTKILGIQFYILPVITDKGLIELNFYHKQADSLNNTNDFLTYQTSDFEKEVKDLIVFFNEISGPPVFGGKYIEPVLLDKKRETLIAIWKNPARVIQLYEDNEKFLPAPVIKITDKKWYEYLDELNKAKKSLDKLLSKTMF